MNAEDVVSRLHQQPPAEPVCQTIGLSERPLRGASSRGIRPGISAPAERSEKEPSRKAVHKFSLCIEATPYDELQGHSHSNTLSVFFDEGNIELYINGARVSNYIDPDPFLEGRIGMVDRG